MPPTALIDSLQEIRRKVRFLAVVFGVGVVAAAAAGLLLATVLLDYELNLPKGPRVVLILAALAGFGLAIYQWLVRPAVANMSLSDIAGRIEHAFPQFEDRLRSTVDFITGRIPGSETMQQRVVSEASQLARDTNLQGVLVLKPVWYSAAGGLLSLTLLSLLAVLAGRGGYLQIALNRLALGSDTWPKTVEIAMQGAIPTRVPVGQRLDLHMKLAKGDRDSRKAVIFYRYDNGPWQQELMTRRDGAYAASIDARIEPGKTSGALQVRIQAGDDMKELAPVLVVPRLEIGRVEAQLTPPPYVKPRTPATVNLADRPAVTAIGSEVALRFAFNKPLAADKPIEMRVLREGQKVAGLKWSRSSDTTAVASFTAAESFRFSIAATDIDGFQNSGGEEYEVIVREDQLPTVQIEEPRRSEERTPNAEFDLKAVAEDDYGIDGAQLVVNRLGDKGADRTSKWVIDLVKLAQPSSAGVAWDPADAASDRKRFHLIYHWQLEKLDQAGLKPGDVLEYFVQVKDNYSLNGHEHDWVPSGKLRISIISPEQWAAAVGAQVEQIHTALKQINQGQLHNKGETETLKEGVEARKKFDEADQAQAERLANQQSTTASQTVQTAQKLQDLVQKMQENKSPEGGMKKTAAEVQRQLEQTADGPMREATKDLGAAKDQKADPKAAPDKRAKDAQSSADAMQKAGANQQVASDQLQQAMEKLGNFGGLAEAREQIEKIKQEQEKLGKDFADKMKDHLGQKPEEMKPEDRDKLTKMAGDQKALADKTQKALDDMAAKGEKLTRSDPSAAEAMKSAAQTGNQQQVSGQQKQSSQSMQQNQQAQAQMSQKQVELGLQAVLDKLREAERRKLEELQRQLAEMQQLIAELIERQSGHNIDNLLLQGGPDRIEKMPDSGQRDDLIALSGRDPKNLGTPHLEQISPSQEQTERNARDVAKKAEALPDPTPAAKLTAAAGQMERAIVHLRNKELADAYDPPQVEALKALVEARKAVDEAKKQVDDQLQQQDQETIRQAYVKLLEAQKKVDISIQTLDVTAKDDTGQLPREAALRLGKLPGEQGALIDTADGLGKKLKDLGSIVYDWANRDILKTMNEVKDDLAKPETGEPTQTAGRLVEDQLQAMIDSLKESKKNSKFAQRPGGGGGGAGSKKPQMPSEAELRLLKQLQEAVNRADKVLDSAKTKDNPKLLALGTRQGELRNLLGKLIENASQGQLKLGPEPDNKDQLPEEASQEDIEDQELDKDLKSGDPAADTMEKGVKLTGDRMARSRQRLALNNDPGQVTQEIQKRISVDLDKLIEMAQQQQANAKSKPGQGKPGEQMAGPKDGAKGQQQAKGQQGKPQQANASAKPAQESTKGQADQPASDLSAKIQESAKEWGGLTPRERQAVQEGAGEKPVERYKNLIDDYYRSLSEQASKR